MLLISEALMPLFGLATSIFNKKIDIDLVFIPFFETIDTHPVHEVILSKESKKKIFDWNMQMLANPLHTNAGGTLQISIFASFPNNNETTPPSLSQWT